MESFGISLLPLVAIVFAQIVSSGGITRDLLDPVDLCFAMLSTTAVLSVQLLDNFRVSPARDIVSSFLVLFIFAIAFSMIGAFARVDQNNKTASLDSAAITASSVLNSANKYIDHPAVDSTLKTYVMQTNISSSAKTLSQDAKNVSKGGAIPTVLVLTSLVTAGFLWFASRIWRNL